MDERKRKIIQLLMQNMPLTYIADKMQVSVSNVHYYLKKHPSLVPEKYQRKRIRSKLYHKEVHILQKLNAGTPKAVIARELGVSREALFNKLAQMGWQETNPYRKKKIDLNLFLKAFNEGKTYQERVVAVHNPQGSTYGAALNQGIDMAGGKYIGIVESDDWIGK